MDENEIELETVDSLGAGAVGDPGEREFFLQARTDSAQLTLLVEKEQVALLATEAVAFLDRIAEDYPEGPSDVPAPVVPQALAHQRQLRLMRARHRDAGRMNLSVARVGKRGAPLVGSPSRRDD